MKQRLHIIYVPGIGDSEPARQRLIVWLWRLYGVDAELLAMHWDGDAELWPAKFDRLLQRIDTLEAAGKRVALIGASAGASAVINAYTQKQHSIVGVVTIAGKLHHPESIGPNYRRNNPAFITSVEACEASLAKLGPNDRKRMLCLYSVRDGLIVAEDSQIYDAHNRMVRVWGHGWMIAYQLTFSAYRMIRFLKRQQIPN